MFKAENYDLLKNTFTILVITAVSVMNTLVLNTLSAKHLINLTQPVIYSPILLIIGTSIAISTAIIINKGYNTYKKITTEKAYTVNDEKNIEKDHKQDFDKVNKETTIEKISFLQNEKERLTTINNNNKVKSLKK